MNQPRPPIIQPGQLNLDCEHKQDPFGNDPAHPVNAVMGSKVAVIGGLTCREEIASRILAGIAGQFSKEVALRVALEWTDDFLAKTRPQGESPTQ